MPGEEDGEAEGGVVHVGQVGECHDCGIVWSPRETGERKRGEMYVSRVLEESYVFRRDSSSGVGACGIGVSACWRRMEDVCSELGLPLRRSKQSSKM